MFRFLVPLLCLIGLVFSQPQPLDITQFAGKTALFISAHPDDIEGLVGGKRKKKIIKSLHVGTIKLLTEQKTDVYYVIVTNGFEIE